MQPSTPPALLTTSDDDTLFCVAPSLLMARRIIQNCCLGLRYHEVTAEWHMAHPHMRYARPLVIIVGQNLIELTETRADGRIGRSAVIVQVDPQMTLARVLR